MLLFALHQNHHRPATGSRSLCTTPDGADSESIVGECHKISDDMIMGQAEEQGGKAPPSPLVFLGEGKKELCGWEEATR